MAKIRKTKQGVDIWLSANDTYNWAHRAGNSWLCSYLSGKRLFVQLDSKGDLMDYTINGKTDSNCPSDEFNAIIADYTKDPPTKVIFRKFKSGDFKGDIIALFPEIAATLPGYTCQSYLHVGQHGSAGPMLIVNCTKPATPEEYADLQKELTEQIGYTLRTVKRFTYSDQQKRQDQCKR